MVIAFIVPFAVMANGQQEGDATTIVFGDLSWDSAQVHNRIAAFIIENGMEGYKADFLPGDTLPILNGVVNGDVDVNMESWHSNFKDAYDQGIAGGEMIDLGANYPDGPQGWWIPRFVVEGDEAMAPGLETVADLPEYAELFKDPEDPSKGIVYGGVAGWTQMMTSEAIFEEYKLGETYNLGIAGSGSALAGAIAGAYKKGEAICAYYWAPTAVLGKFDMIRLKGSEYDPAKVNILINKSMNEKAPDIVEMLKNYSTSVDDNNEFLAKMEENGWDSQQAAEWFLKNKEDVWSEWVSSDVAAKVKAAL